MVLENLKSYAGKQHIGPFHKCFSAVVGPNGSGKSNVIDAMLFVFGKRAKQGEVELISLMKPKAQTPHDEGFLEYLENTIGSNKYVERIDAASKQLGNLIEHSRPQLCLLEELNEKNDSMVQRVRVVEKEKSGLEVEIRSHASVGIVIGCQRLNTARVELEPWEKHIIECESKIGVTSLASKLLKDKVSEKHSEQWNESITKLQSCYSHEDEFMGGFNSISMKLKEMYQMITLGGDAELELVDSLDPFAEGVVFTVRPPKKRWKAIANLSGGEKGRANSDTKCVLVHTLSSLALVFPLHHYKPTPLYIMDEIDAALDFKNVSIVGHCIQKRAKDAQFVIIRLRNNMFELADYLIGIYKTDNCTKSISINPHNFFVPVSSDEQKQRQIPDNSAREVVSSCELSVDWELVSLIA